MDDTWTSRELPVLEAAIVLVDARPGGLHLGRDLAVQTDLGEQDIMAELRALHPGYVTLGRQLAAGGGLQMRTIDSVTAAGRRAVGQCPTGQGLIEQLVAGLTAAAEQEPDPERRSKPREIAFGLGGAAKGIASTSPQR